MVFHNVEQGTEEWHKLRELKMTGSNAQAIATAGKGLETYIKSLITEAIAGRKDRYYGADMKRGHELEPIAVAKYEFEKNVDVIQIGFAEYSKYLGYSPDGLVGEEGLIECKARNNDIHLGLLLTGKVDTKTEWQMQMGMLLLNRKWCDFISYNPNFKKSIFIKRFYPSSEMQNKLKKGFYEGEKMIKELLSNEVIKFELN